MPEDSKPVTPAYLKNRATGVVFVATDALLKRGDLVPCDKDGNDPEFEEVVVKVPAPAPVPRAPKAKKAADAPADVPPTPEALAAALTGVVTPTGA